MRLSLGLLVVGSLALVACSGEDGDTIRRGNNLGGPAAGAGGDTTPAAVTPAAPTCPATVAVPRTVSTQDTSAADVRIVRGDVIYRQATKVVRVDPKGLRTEIYASADLVHAFADDTLLVTIESPNPPDAVLKFMPIGPTTPSAGQPALPPQELTITPDGWNAGGTYIFASDATSLYAVADVAAKGDTIYKIDKSNPAQMTVLAQLDAPLTDPQLSGSDVWFVREQKRVYKVTQTASDPKDPTATTASTPTEVFGIGYADCKLAVGGNHAFCSTGKALEQRDLSGANLTTVFDSQTATSKSLLGAAMFGSDTVFVRSLPENATDLLKNGIRAVKTGGAAAGEKFVACGREPINALAVDDTSVAWAEQGKGVFLAPR